MEFLIIAVLGLLAIALAQTLGDKLRVAAPLILVAIGIVVSLLPFVPSIEIEPEWILAGVLPPLLYSASASMPSMDFRREFSAIGGLSVVLVVGSSVLLGLFFAWTIPDLGLAWGIALGAIVSPTDAVATGIVKRLGVSPRAVSILEGESLLNDATALVILRAGIAGAAVSVSLWSVVGEFAVSVILASLIGALVGKANLWARARIKDPAVNTVVAFTVPFLASVPAEELGASGLVAAVVAGLVTGRGAARVLSPRHRLSDSQNWRAIEVILEGAVFLLMGLELWTVVDDVSDEPQGIGFAVAVAAGALALTVLIRAAYVAPLLAGLKRRAEHGIEMKPQISGVQSRLDGTDEGWSAIVAERRESNRLTRRRAASQRGVRTPSARRIEQLQTRLRRRLADIDYLLAKPLGWREGTVVVWAGMRGAVTLAAAQTLPEDAPHRSLLVLIAFLVAGGSLLIQGGSLAWVVALVKPAGPDRSADAAEHAAVAELLAQAAATVPTAGAAKPRELAVIHAQRSALLDARDDGAFSSAALNAVLTVLDADEISLEIKGAPAG